MILQAYKGLNSRQEAIPFNKDGFLPLITAPMYSVVDESNYQVFLDNKVQVCLPRLNNFPNFGKQFAKEGLWRSINLSDFKTMFLDKKQINSVSKVCIDTANGNMPALHEAICKAKEIHGDKLIIMAGNVASVEAFVELAKTGVDYIRVGIGGGAACNTTANTGVGQHSLGDLIWECNNTRQRYRTTLTNDNFYRKVEGWENVANVKIVADGISSYIKFCQKEYNFYDNGYAAINTLLFNGADLVMLGSIFAQCLESVGEKSKSSPIHLSEAIQKNYYIKNPDERDPQWYIWDVKLQGMSTEEAQKKYKTPVTTSQMAIMDFQTGTSEVIGDPIHYYGNKIKPSEGKTIWIPVRWTLNEWLYGNGTDEIPGFVNMLKSVMAYLGATTLDEIPKNNY